MKYLLNEQIKYLLQTNAAIKHCKSGDKLEEMLQQIGDILQVSFTFELQDFYPRKGGGHYVGVAIYWIGFSSHDDANSNTRKSDSVYLDIMLR